MWRDIKELNPRVGDFFWIWDKRFKEPILSEWGKNHIGEGWIVNLENPTVAPYEPVYFIHIVKPLCPINPIS